MHTRTVAPLVRALPPLLILLGAGCTAPAHGGPSPGAAPPLGPDGPTTAWTGDCPYADGSLVSHLALVELSPSEVDPRILANRLASIEGHARQAADCEAPFSVFVLIRGRAEAIHQETFDSPLGTEVARDRQVTELAAGAMAHIQPELERQATLDAQPGSDPGVAFRVLSEQLLRLEPDATIDALILSDGVTHTDTVHLNQPLTDTDVTSLADQVAPAVDLAQRVRVDWPDLGRTADPDAPPSPWLDQLRSLWERVCQTRRAAECTVTTI